MAERADGSIIIDVKVDTAEAEKGLNDLSDEAEGLSKPLKDTEKAAFSLGDAIKANVISNAVVSGFGVLTDAVKGFASGMVGTAADLKAEASQYEQTFGDMGDTATSVISDIADSTGILETRLNSAATSIYAFARSSGGSELESMDLMEGALTAAADAAAYYDRSLGETTDQLMSFLKGNYENDAALGLSATETTRNAAAMEQFGKKFNDLTEIQKQQTLLKMVQDAQELSGAMGQASRESDGLENVMGNLNEVGRQTQGNIGAPILEAIIPAIQEITNSLMQWSEGMDWDAFGDAVGGFVTGMIDNGPTIISLIAGIAAGFVAWNVVSTIQGVVAAITAFRKANEGATIAQLAMNAAMNANPIGIVITAIAALIAIIGTLWATNEDFRNAVMEIWENIKQAFVTAWENINAAWDAAQPYFQAIWDAIQSIFSVVSDVLTGFFSAAWSGITGVWDAATGFFENIWNTIEGIFSVVESVLSGDFAGAWEAIKGVFSGWKQYFTDRWNDLTNIFNQAWDFFSGIGSDIVDGIKNGISNAWEGLKNWFNGLWNGLFGNRKASVTVERNAVDAATSRSAGLASASRMIADIPHLARGAVIPPNREFMAVLGDQTRGNNIEAPEDLIRRIVREESGGMTTELLQQILAAIQAGQVIKVNETVLGRTSAKAINKITRSSGKSVLLY